MDDAVENKYVDHMVTLTECERQRESENITYTMEQVFAEQRPSSTRRFRAVYALRAVGILPNVRIVDTTGAGDAFWGGYLAARLDPQSYPTVTDSLRLATWVAGHKIRGPGARTTLPTAKQRDEQLGTLNPAAALRELITSFQGVSC